MLERLGDEGSAESFYRGDIAEQIAAAFEANGGIVTTEDLAAYRALEHRPIRVEYGDHVVLGPPPPCPSATPLEALAICRELGWETLAPGVARTHARVEATRLAWRDRFNHIADPEGKAATTERLLSAEYAAELAGEVREAVAAQKAIETGIGAGEAPGTLHFSAVDREGGMVSMTLTHGASFGACVTVPGLGLTLGHGMTRFDAGTPNSMGPRKRP